MASGRDSSTDTRSTQVIRDHQWLPRLRSIPHTKATASSVFRDRELLAKIRTLVRREVAGYHAEDNGAVDKCLEPCCPCFEGTCSVFRDPPGRCIAVEQYVLPLDPDLFAAYKVHLVSGAGVELRRCAWKDGCPRLVAGIGPAAKFCRVHSRLRKLHANRESARKRREAARTPGVGKTGGEAPSQTLGNGGLAKAGNSGVRGVRYPAIPAEVPASPSTPPEPLVIRMYQGPESLNGDNGRLMRRGPGA